MNLLLLTTMFVVDSRPLRERSRRLDVSLKQVYANDAALVADLEQRLGGRVMYHEVTEVDYVHGRTAVDVRYRPGSGVAAPEPTPEPAEHAAVALSEPTVPGETAPQAIATQVVPAPSETRSTELVLASSTNGPRINGAVEPE
jgi:hypothetical protein